MVRANLSLLSCREKHIQRFRFRGMVCGDGAHSGAAVIDLLLCVKIALNSLYHCPSMVLRTSCYSVPVPA